MLKKKKFPVLNNESGFILALVMFYLAVCTLLGLSAMNTTVDELDITKNEVAVKRLFALAGSGLPLAAIPLLNTQGAGDPKWAFVASTGKSVYLSDEDPTVTADHGVIQIVDPSFLGEGFEEDRAFKTGWNNAQKYIDAPDEAHAAQYQPIDDPFFATSASQVKEGSLGLKPDLRIRSADLVLDVDVDKASVAYLAGGVAEFGSGAEGAAGTAYKIVYLMDCKATLPPKDITDPASPSAEVILGYRFLPDSGI